MDFFVIVCRSSSVLWFELNELLIEICQLNDDDNDDDEDLDDDVLRIISTIYRVGVWVKDKQEHLQNTKRYNLLLFCYFFVVCCC